MRAHQRSVHRDRVGGHFDAVAVAASERERATELTLEVLPKVILQEADRHLFAETDTAFAVRAEMTLRFYDVAPERFPPAGHVLS